MNNTTKSTATLTATFSNGVSKSRTTEAAYTHASLRGTKIMFHLCRPTLSSSYEIVELTTPDAHVSTMSVVEDYAAAKGATLSTCFVFSFVDDHGTHDRHISINDFASWINDSISSFDVSFGDAHVSATFAVRDGVAR
tara:strand:- start:691 stop:1104 length:414 start_codon:yes stop_codon:yes gene_type:complete